ncbi:MAG: hypothetical protein RLZ52_298 [Pseudomonadota bacterium]|jgi:hypothetical protein
MRNFKKKQTNSRFFKKHIKLIKFDLFLKNIKKLDQFFFKIEENK